MLARRRSSQSTLCRKRIQAMHEIQPDAVQVCTADARMQGRRCRSQSPLGTNTSLEDKTFFFPTRSASTSVQTCA